MSLVPLSHRRRRRCGNRFAARHDGNEYIFRRNLSDADHPSPKVGRNLRSFAAKWAGKGENHEWEYGLGSHLQEDRICGLAREDTRRADVESVVGWLPDWRNTFGLLQARHQSPDRSSGLHVRETGRASCLSSAVASHTRRSVF